MNFLKYLLFLVVALNISSTMHSALPEPGQNFSEEPERKTLLEEASEEKEEKDGKASDDVQECKLNLDDEKENKTLHDRNRIDVKEQILDLNLRGYDIIDDEKEPQNINDSVKKRISLSSIIRHKNITAVNLSGAKSITNKIISAIAQSFSSLQKLYLQDCNKITDESIAILARECKGLQLLDLENCDQITDKSIQALAQCKNLQGLYLLGCNKITDTSIAILARECKGLQLLDLENCDQITDKSIQALAQCKNLQKLYLLGCNKITDESIAILARECKDLQILSLNNCDQITDNSIQALAQCKNLQKLYLIGCNKITDASIAILAHECKGLQILDLRDCNLISNEGIRTLAHECKNLQELYLKGCNKITDESIIIFARKCKGLKVLGLENCNQITDKSIHALAQCKNLQNLYLKGSDKITQKTIGLIDNILLLRKHAVRPTLIFNTENLVNRKKLDSIITSLATCKNIPKYLGLVADTRLFGDIDFGYMYASLDKKEINADTDNLTNTIINRLNLIEKDSCGTIPNLISMGQSCLDQNQSAIQKNETCQNSLEYAYCNNMRLLTLANIANLSKITPTPADKLRLIIAESINRHSQIYLAIIESIIIFDKNHEQLSNSVKQKQQELENTKKAHAQHQEALEIVKKALEKVDEKTAVYAEIKEAALKTIDHESRSKIKEQELDEKVTCRTKLSYFKKALKKIEQEYSNKIEKLQQELTLLQDNLDKAKTERAIKVKICTATMHALFTCLSDPEEALAAAQQTKGALIDVDADMASEAYNFIVHAITKLQEDVHWTINMALGFNLAHLKALMLQSTTLCSNKQENFDHLAQEASYYDEKIMQAALDKSQNFLGKSALALAEAKSALEDDEKNQQKIDRITELNDTLNNEQKIAQTLCKGKRLSPQAFNNAQENLTRLAQNKQISLANMRKQAEKNFAEIKSIVQALHQHLITKATGVTPEQFLDQASQYLTFIKTNEVSQIRTLVLVDPATRYLQARVAAITAQPARSTLKRHEEKTEITDDQDEVEFQQKRRKTTRKPTAAQRAYNKRKREKDNK